MRSRAWIAMTILALLFGIACTSPGGPISPSASASHTSTTSPVSNHPSPNAGDPTRTSPGTAVATLPGYATDLATGPDEAIYAAYFVGEGHMGIARIDSSSGRVWSSRPIFGVADRQGEIAVAAGSIWVAGQDPHDPNASHQLFRMDSDSLHLLSAITMSAPPVAVAPSPAGIWVAAGRDLILLKADGGLIRTVPVSGHVTHLAIDPAGNRLYVATDKKIDRRDHVAFEERDASSGGLLAQGRGVGYAGFGGPTDVTATPAGAWIASPTGMMASLEFLRASDLRPAAPIIERSNAVLASFTSGRLWI